MKKGFTLIELLAVIVVLGLIVLVVTPNVLNLFDTSKEATYKTSVSNMAQAGTQYYAMNVLDFDHTMNLYDKVDFVGESPTEASIYIDKNGNTIVAAVFNDVCYLKMSDSNEIIIASNVLECQIEPPSDVFE